MPEMISLEEARALVLSRMELLSVEKVSLLDAVGRASAADLFSDIDVSPFAHAAMDGYALRAEELAAATDETPVELDVIAEVAAGDWFERAVGPGQCVRIMTGAPVPVDVDAVVKYEIVDVASGDGKAGSRVVFKAPTKQGSNIRAAGEEAHAGDCVISKGEVINAAGVGFMASCGIVEVPVYARPRVAVIATGSELVPPTEVPTKGKIRNSNSYAIAACVQAAGGIPDILPARADSLEGLKADLSAAVRTHDFVITTGGAANGDFDFIKPAVFDLGELLMTLVNMRPGKAQTFGIVEGTPVFGLPGNPAAAYVGFEMIIRAGLRKMQGFSHFDRPVVKARLAHDVKKKDPRRIFLRGSLCAGENGYVVTPASNQSSGLLGTLQRSNCLAIMPEGLDSRTAGSVVECALLDVPEELSL